MKILHTVEFYYPSIGGAQELVRHLSERMVRMGHDVTVATTRLPDRTSQVHNGVKIVDFDIAGNNIRGIIGSKQEYKDFLLKSNFDVIMNFAAQEWAADLFFEVIDDIKAKKVMVPCGYSAFEDPAYSDYFKKLPDILRKYDATIYPSNDYQDINFAREHKLENIFVIPNAANEDEFSEPLSSERRKFLRTKYGIGGLTIMTIGLYGEKGHMELMYAFKRLPVSKATLISAGSVRPHEGCYDEFETQADRVNSSRKFLGKRVVMVDGSQTEEVHDLLKICDVFAFFSHTECSPLVLFEAAAAGVPFVSTKVGNSAEIAKWTGGGIIAKTHKVDNGRVRVDLKDAVWQLTKLAHSRKRRQSLGKTARQTWKDKYTWDKIAKEYLKVYEKVLKSG